MHNDTDLTQFHQQARKLFAQFMYINVRFTPTVPIKITRNIIMSLLFSIYNHTLHVFECHKKHELESSKLFSFRSN